MKKYDYCESNMDQFLREASRLPSMKFELSESGFEKFTSVLNEMIENNFKASIITSKTKSKRNRLLNPWITSGIIASICTKCKLYETWKLGCTKSNPSGDSSDYLKYKDFRQALCKTIKYAKKAYYSAKFDKASGNIKKLEN